MLFNKINIIAITILLFARLFGQDCVVDSVISDLPFAHNDSTVGRGDDWNFEQNWGPEGDGEDYTYELTLTTPITIFIDTCDPYSNYDTIIAIKDSSQCQVDPSNASLIDFHQFGIQQGKNYL